MKTSDIERFWSKVDQAGGPAECWPWTGNTGTTGYGQFWLAGTMRGAHRVAYELGHGVGPGVMHVMHACDTPPCCNPAHLSLGTNAENMADRNAKGRAHRPTGSSNPRARLTEQDVAEIRRLSGQGMLTLEIAEQFDVSTVTVNKVVGRRTWRHVA